MTALSDKTSSEAFHTGSTGVLVFDPKHQQQDPTLHGLDKRVMALEIFTKAVKEDLANINSNITRLVWIVITAVLLAILSLVIRSVSQGGL